MPTAVFKIKSAPALHHFASSTVVRNAMTLASVALPAQIPAGPTVEVRNTFRDQKRVPEPWRVLNSEAFDQPTLIALLAFTVSCVSNSFLCTRTEPARVLISLSSVPEVALLLFHRASSFTILCLLLLFNVIENSATETHRNSWGIIMKSVKRFTLLLTLFTALGAAHFLFAQGTDLGTIRGTVKDASSAVIGNAKVTVTDLETNTSRQANTNGAGDYEVFGLKSGRYKVSVTAAGMSTEEINDVVVNGSATVGVDVTLRVSAAGEKIEVSASATTINTENPTISDTIGHQSVIDLPRDSRDIYSFLYLNPNITGADEPGDFKFIGGQSYGGSFSVDGQRSNGGIFGSQTDSKPSLEAVDELNVLSNSFSAEYAGTANIRITTKRGQNQFHGSLFYNNANSALAALSLQDLAGIADFQPNAFASKYPTPYFNINDLGGSIGGPIKGLKRTWFFAAYERDYDVSPVDISTTKLAHPSLWTGNFSGMTDNSGSTPVYNEPDVPAGVVLTAQEIADDTVGGAGLQFLQIPSRLLNPSVQTLITKYFPHIGTTAPIDPTTGRIPSFQTQLPWTGHIGHRLSAHRP